jgi:hypothetical protein
VIRPSGSSVDANGNAIHRGELRVAARWISLWRRWRSGQNGG